MSPEYILETSYESIRAVWSGTKTYRPSSEVFRVEDGLDVGKGWKQHLRDETIPSQSHSVKPLDNLDALQLAPIDVHAPSVDWPADFKLTDRKPFQNVTFKVKAPAEFEPNAGRLATAQVEFDINATELRTQNMSFEVDVGQLLIAAVVASPPVWYSNGYTSRVIMGFMGYLNTAIKGVYTLKFSCAWDWKLNPVYTFADFDATMRLTVTSTGLTQTIRTRLLPGVFSTGEREQPLGYHEYSADQPVSAEIPKPPTADPGSTDHAAAEPKKCYGPLGLPTPCGGLWDVSGRAKRSTPEQSHLEAAVAGWEVLPRS